MAGSFTHIHCSKKFEIFPKLNQHKVLYLCLYVWYVFTQIPEESGLGNSSEQKLESRIFKKFMSVSRWDSYGLGQDNLRRKNRPHIIRIDKKCSQQCQLHSQICCSSIHSQPLFFLMYVSTRPYTTKVG